jgi:hypothetical protein
MTRIAALIAGLVLIGLPIWWLRDVTVPLPEYRKGGFADYLFYGQALLAIYGGVLLGIAVHWVRANRSGQSLFPFELFKAGMQGMLAAAIAFFAVHFAYGMMTHGNFEKAIGGNLWGMTVIFWAVLSAIVSAGMALLFYAWRGPAGYTGGMPGSGRSGMPLS